MSYLRHRVTSLLIALPLAAACASGRIGLRKVDPLSAYASNSINALSFHEPSNETQIVLRRFDLRDEFRAAPAAAIAALRQAALQGRGGPDAIFALAELSFLHGVKLGATPPFSTHASHPARSMGRSVAKIRATPPPADTAQARSYFLSSAIYAYAFLFPESTDEQVDFIDPRARIAADIYDRALAETFVRGTRGESFLAAGTFPVPFGEVHVDFDRADLTWGKRELVNLRWVGDAEIEGLINRYRQAGVGSPVVAQTRLFDQQGDFVDRNAWVPATLVLRLDQPRRQLESARLDAVLEVRTATQPQPLEIGEHVFPLSTDRSTALAATLEQSRFWESELSRFLGSAIGVDKATNLSAQEPYVPGKIPAVFVHGTQSSPATWANMINDLQHDPRIRARYHFWFFSYDSGNPILYSGTLLRRALRDAVANLGTGPADACLQQMAVIGHSQGGLLTKLMAIDSGSRFWDAQYDTPLDKIRLRPAARDLLREAAFVKPLPFISRVIFIATPHRGSYLASPQLVRRLAARLIQLPREVVEVSAATATLGRFARPGTQFERLTTSIDNMSPGHPFIETIAGIPLAPTVTVNSIVALLPGESEQTGGDGVVKFQSAHLEDKQSELVVSSGHSTLGNPHTIEEVRRILLLHADEQTCWQNL